MLRVSFVPVVASSRVLNGKLPLSKNRVCVMYVVCPFFFVGFLCPVSWPDGIWSSGVCSASTWLIPAACHFLFSISENAVMMNRNITKNRLSPCLTPTVWSMSVVSFPILSVICKSE